MEHKYKIIILVIVGLLLLASLVGAFLFYFFYWRKRDETKPPKPDPLVPPEPPATNFEGFMSQGSQRLLKEGTHVFNPVFVSPPASNDLNLYNTSTGVFTARKDGFYDLGISGQAVPTGDDKIWIQTKINVNNGDVISSSTAHNTKHYSVSPMTRAGFAKLKKGDTVTFEVRNLLATNIIFDGMIWAYLIGDKGNGVANAKDSEGFMANSTLEIPKGGFHVFKPPRIGKPPFSNDQALYDESTGEFTAPVDGYYDLGMSGSLYPETENDLTVSVKTRINLNGGDAIIASSGNYGEGVFAGTTCGVQSGFTKLKKGDTITFEVNNEENDKTLYLGTIWGRLITANY